MHPVQSSLTQSKSNFSAYGSFLTVAYPASAVTSHIGPVDGIYRHIFFSLYCVLNLTLKGAYYTYRAPFDLALTNLSPCGRTDILNVATSVIANNADNTSGSGYISTDSVGTRPHFCRNYG